MPRGVRPPVVLEFDLREMERNHVYTKWMFPVTEASKVQPSSPVMGEGGLEEFRMNFEIHVMARKASQKFAIFPRQTTVWQYSLDHNHLRITRVLRLLTLSELVAAARALYGYVLSRGSMRFQSGRYGIGSRHSMSI